MKEKIYGEFNLTQFISDNQLENLPETVFRNIRYQEKQLLGFKPVCEIIPVFIFDTNPVIRFIQGYVALKYKGYYFRVHSEADDDKVFLLSFDQDNDHPYLQSFTNIASRPGKIGKATPVRMDDWLNYLIAEKQAKDKHIALTTARLDNFFSLLHRFDDSIIWEENKKSGKILLHGLKFSFIVRDDGRVEQHIALIPFRQDLETFIQMSDNKYTGPLASDKEDTTGISFWEYALDFINGLPAQKSETVRRYKSHVQKFNKLYPGIALKEVDDGMIRNFEKYMLTTLHKSLATTQLTVNFIRRLLKASIEKEDTKTTPET